MTYCLGLLVREGLVMLADTRTNAGVDNISAYRKLRLYGNDGQRLIAVASAGSLSTTQEALERASLGLVPPDGKDAESLSTVGSIHRAAYLLGHALRGVRQEMEGLKEDEVSFEATLLVGGAIGGERTRLFLVYSAGNFIECEPETPYLQIGETKYGKPILDRAISYETEIGEALKTGLISFNSTMRSNLAVGLPIDLAVTRSGACRAELEHRIDDRDAYWRELDERWARALRDAQASIPRPPYGSARATKPHAG